MLMRAKVDTHVETVVLLRLAKYAGKIDVSVNTAELSQNIVR